MDKKDCYSCKLIGTGSFVGLGMFSLYQSRIAHLKDTRVTAATLFTLGLGCLGLAYHRWTLK